MQTPSSRTLLSGATSATRSDETPDPERLQVVVGANAPPQLSWLSTLTFQYFQPLMNLGATRPLENDDLPVLPTQDRAEEINKEFAENLRRHRTVSMALVTTFWRPYFKAGLCKLPHDICVFVGPSLLRVLIALLEQEHPNLSDGLWAVFGIFATGIIQTICLQQYFHRVYRVSYNSMAALNVVIYDKSLVITNTARAENPVGQTVNLISVDVETIAALFSYLQNLLWSSQFQITVAMVMLYSLLGWSVLLGLLTMFLLMGLNIKLLKWVKAAQKANLEAKDERIKAVNEALHSMRAVKVLALEPKFITRIEAARSREFAALCKFQYLGGLQRSTYELISVIVSLVTFAVHSMRGLPLQLSVVMPALLLFQLLRFPITLLPMLLSNVVSAKLSARRLDKFLSCDELGAPPSDAWWPEAAGVVVRDGGFEWTPGAPVLRDITLQMPRGGLTVVVGAVGSGKSSVLAACLGEMVRVSGRAAVQHGLAYVPQQAWVLNDSVRNNILFGAEYEPERYAAVVACCALEEDFRQLHSGDATEVGEQGIVISGGQKQRISLARATYADASILLLDDPLSAVDSHVARHLFEQCILGKLDGKTRVLVTHKLELLPHADHCIVMGEGTVAFAGTYEQLLESGLDVTAYVPQEAASRDASQHGGKSADGADGADSGGKGGASGGAAAAASEKAKVGSGGGGGNGGSGGGAGAAGGGPSVGSKDGGGMKLMSAEERAVGTVASKTWWRYFHVAGVTLMMVPFGLGVLCQAAKMATSGWLAWWASMDDGAIAKAIGVFISGYVGWLLATVVLSVGRDCVFAYAELRAASIIHNDMLSAVMHAPMVFFDTTPLGRIIARFSKDQNTLDIVLPQSLNALIGCLIEVGGTLLVVCISSPLFILGLLPIGYVYYKLQRYYASTARELKRLDSISRSPLYAFFGETLAGTTSIRAYHRQAFFRAAAARHIDSINRVQAALFTANRWLGLRVEALGACIATFAALATVLGRVMTPEMSQTQIEQYAALAGLSLSYALSVTNTLGWSVRMIADTETAMNAVERTNHYTELEREPQTVGDGRSRGGGGDGGATAASAIRDNSIEFREYYMRYREGLPLVLANISCTFQSNERIGIVGRTGSGKSSLAAALLRLVPAAGGAISIGGVNIDHIPLAQLRSMMAVVPQDPVMFAGSLRQNLDPNGSHSDARLEAALEQVNMLSAARALPGFLEAVLTENGGNFSVGERQLLCLARALLRGSRLIILDEATSAVDLETDSNTTEMLRAACSECTLLTIAHRLHTIIDYDRIAVLDAGKLRELDPPAVLLQRPDSLFSQLVQATGAETAQQLTQLAEKAFSSSEGAGERV